MSPPVFTAYRDQGALHLWAGAFGIHLYWPDLWKSRPDHCRNWRIEP